MTSGMSYSSIKIAHQVREFVSRSFKGINHLSYNYIVTIPSTMLMLTINQLYEEEKRSQDRKRNLLCLIHQYLLDEGYHLTAETFDNESHITKQLTVCDNIDLSTVLQEYETYYFLRFQKYPKICRKTTAAASGNPVVEKVSRSVRKNLEASNTNTTTLEDSSTAKIPPSSLPSSSSNLSRANTRPANVARAKANVGARCANLEVIVTPLTSALSEQQEVTSSTHNTAPERLAKPYSSCYASLGAEWREYIDSISKEIFVENTGVAWNDVKGVETAKALLKEAVVYPTKYPELFKNILTPWRGFLLFGPPGTGKTLLAKAVATESQSTFFNISASSIVSKWRGESEKLVRALFEVARQQAPSIIFFDELDCVASKSDAVEHEASRRLKSELLVQLDGLADTGDRVFLLATSNKPWDLDPAMLRRLEKRILVDLPNVEARELMIRHHLPPKIIEESNTELRCELDYNYLAEALEGYSGSDIRLVCKEAAMCLMRKAFAALETTQKSDELDLDIMTTADVMEAIQRTKPSACDLVQRYRAWFQQSGSA
ncbi:katanin p60 ATPase-containing subunit A-like 2 isoform X1 [Nilaparvata lugens]|uniref:katanin p60 ATPase-containing subunit A-like 2 isoform X1 n=1 Tax=Nilaparvata lugens TaxID=108931 RepID=UPI00193DE306|nr:katanin p60 ATPase-containing subunit A-like 2 isoform X1 [Nilaparvata lugens]